MYISDSSRSLQTPFAEYELLMRHVQYPTRTSKMLTKLSGISAEELRSRLSLSSLRSTMSTAVRSRISNLLTGSVDGLDSASAIAVSDPPRISTGARLNSLVARLKANL